MPEMDVVRFKESDVIVASGIYHLDNTHDSQGWNMYLKNTATNKYVVNNVKGQGSVVYNGSMGNSDQLQFYYATNSFITLQALIDNDSADTPVSTSGIDGDYLWNGSFFTKKQ